MRPSWPEVLAGLLALVVVGIGGAVLVTQLPIDPVAVGLSLAALSGVGGMAGFLAAFVLRLRSWSAFGVQPTTARWLFIAAGAGVAAFVVKGFAILGYIWLIGVEANPQAIFVTGAIGETWALVLATVFVSFLTPLGEELLFRGVVTNALLRFGPLVGVVGGALIFALFHGVNLIFPAALIAGLAAGEVFRRSGSIWPAVTLHVVYNLPTVPMLALAEAAQSAPSP